MQTVTLSNGIEMPQVGFGVFQIAPGEATRNAVKIALNAGYRLIDTAQAYLNEESVGDAIKISGIERKDIFLATKIWVSNCGEENAYQSILESLRRLQTNYVDLILIHQPFGDYYGTYRAMERAYKEGKVKAIGLSNFYPDRFADLCHFVEIKPMVNQIETNVFNQQREAKELMKQKGCQTMAWGPFAEGKKDFFNNETLVNVGLQYGKSSAQVALRFLVQEDVIVIPKSSHKERIEENVNIFDFELSPSDMAQIRALNKEDTFPSDHYSADTVEFLVNYKV